VTNQAPQIKNSRNIIKESCKRMLVFIGAGIFRPQSKLIYAYIKPGTLFFIAIYSLNFLRLGQVNY
ncbi:MAG: hypothetical protein JWQ14_242, partial [Adhaeribacter sp.]|nr:hypothetical protein [Adhaeribacter sp.]